MSPGRMDDLKFTFDPAILEESSLAYCILDMGGRILFINRAMEILFGHAVEDCVGRSISMLSPEPDEAVELVTGALDRGRGTCQGEMNARSRDGRTFPCQVTATRFSGSGPDTTVTLGMFRDISGHVQTLEALKSRSDRLGALASIAARIGVYTDSHRLALEAMEAISRLLPIRAGFLLLLDPESGELRLHEAFNLPRGDRELYHAEPGWDQCLEGHVVREKVAILIPDVSRDDRAVHVAPGSMSLAIIPLLTPERVIGVLSVTTAEPHRLDQSDMEFLFTLGAHLGIYLENARLVEELQKRNSMLLEHNQDLEELLSIISHDLRSPLATIGGFASLLMKKGEKISAEERSRFAETIFRKTRETSERFDDLLTIFRMSFAEEEDAHPRAVNVGDVIASALEESAPEEIRGRFSIELPGNLPRLLGYPHHLTHLFTNLLSNAFKFMGSREDPRIEILYEKVQDGGCVFHRFSVVDNGVGIPADYLPGIFKPFTRGPATEDIPGTGVGLAAVWRIVRNHRGTVEISSTEGEGTTIVFTLPWPEIP